MFKAKALQGKIAAGVVAVSVLFAAFFSLQTYAADPTSTATVTFTAGTLSMANLPNLDFGSTHTIQATTTDYSVTSNATLQILDLRGNGAGWSLSAKLSPFQNSASNPSLQGASISLGTIGVAPLNGTANLNLPVASTTPVLTSDNTLVRLVNAVSGKGLGVWGATLSTSDVKLNVLGGTAQTGANTATITWVLGDAA